MSSALESAIQAHRTRLLAGDKAALDLMLRAYEPVRTRLVSSIDALTAEIAASGVTDGTAALKLERARELFAQVEAEIGRLSSGANALITEGQRQAVGLAGEGALSLAAAQSASVAASWNRVPTEAVRELVGRMSDGSPLRAWLDDFGPETSEAIRDGLIDGLARGIHPTTLAAELAGKVDVAGTRLLTTTRSQILGAYRGAALASYQANEDVLSGWTWLSALSGSCAACVHLHGKEFALSERFMPVHLRCRCTAIPNVRDADPIIASDAGDEWFAKQDASYQDRILHGTGGAAYRSGELSLADFTELHRDQRWGNSYRQASVAQARRAAKEQRRAA